MGLALNAREAGIQSGKRKRPRPRLVRGLRLEQARSRRGGCSKRRENAVPAGEFPQKRKTIRKKQRARAGFRPGSLVRGDVTYQFASSPVAAVPLIGANGIMHACQIARGQTTHRRIGMSHLHSSRLSITRARNTGSLQVPGGAGGFVTWRFAASP